jgi:hypothetical protein
MTRTPPSPTERELARALEGLLCLVQHETNLPESAENGVTCPNGQRDEGVYRAWTIMEDARLALHAYQTHRV